MNKMQKRNRRRLEEAQKAQNAKTAHRAIVFKDLPVNNRDVVSTEPAKVVPTTLKSNELPILEIKKDLRNNALFAVVAFGLLIYLSQSKLGFSLIEKFFN